MTRQVPLHVQVPRRPNGYELENDYSETQVPLPSPERLLPSTAVYNYFPLLRLRPSTIPNRPETHASKLRFRSGVVRIRSTVLLRLLLGSVLLPCGIPDAGSAELDAGAGSVAPQELVEDRGCLLETFRCSVVVSTRIRS
uniref:Transposase n=1 Tax=Secale sylvestre TaxID=4552 RepID=A5HVC7_9POAL|nr:transposase [Secale sylvestre]